LICFCMCVWVHVSVFLFFLYLVYMYLVYDYIIIMIIISLGSSLLGVPTSISSKGNTSKFGSNRGGVVVLSRKSGISPKRSKIGARLLLMTNRKLHTRFLLLPKSMTLNDLERPLCTLFRNNCVLGAHLENLNKYRRTVCDEDVAKRL